MHAALSAENLSSNPSISVYCDEKLLFEDILASDKTPFLACPEGSRIITVINNRGRVIFDLWLSVAPKKRHILKVYNDYCSLSTSPSP